MNDKKTYGFTTTILHSDRQKGIEHGSLHKPIHTSVTFGYEDARQLAEVFQGKQPGYRYGRQGNPTVSALEDKITKMEDGKSTICFATGMAAIGAIVQGLLREGDHVVSSAFLFGNTNSLWMTVAAQGAKVSMVDATDVKNVEAAITPQTRLVFVETIANPRTQVVLLRESEVLAGLGELALLHTYPVSCTCRRRSKDSWTHPLRRTLRGNNCMLGLRI